MTKLEKHIVKLTAKWKKRLGLADWTLYTSFEKTRGDTTRACVLERHWEYRYAVIEFYTDTCKNDEDLERHVVHELLHCVLAELESKRKKHEERVVVTLADAFIHLAERDEKR